MFQITTHLLYFDRTLLRELSKKCEQPRGNCWEVGLGAASSSMTETEIAWLEFVFVLSKYVGCGFLTTVLMNEPVIAQHGWQWNNQIKRCNINFKGSAWIQVVLYEVRYIGKTLLPWMFGWMFLSYTCKMAVWKLESRCEGGNYLINQYKDVFLCVYNK